MIGICPNCGERYVCNSYDTDFVHKCNSGKAVLDQEDIVVVGDYIDENTGLTVAKPKTGVAFQGAVNKLKGTLAGLEGYKNPTLTDRGVKASTHRQRQHEEHINIK